MKTILFFGYYDPASPRTWILKKRYNKKGYEIVECLTSKVGFIRKCFDLKKQYKELKKEIDEVLVLFPGHYIMPLAWILTRAPKKKLTFDAFVSIYDSMVSDRAMITKRNPKAWIYWIVDFFSCHLADEVLIDTQTHREFFINKFKINPKKIHVIYLEAISDLFHPNQQRTTNNEQRTTFDIFFYGSFIPLQGIDVILKAAKILESKPQIHFTLLGGGQTYPEMKILSEELNLTNITFKPFVPMEELPDHINAADLCLGIFGTSEKAQRVIPHKVLDYLACGKKVITAKTPGILERFANDENVILCKAGDSEELAAKIMHELQTSKV